MMLNHLADTQGDVAGGRVARRIKEACNRALADGKKTRDLGGELSTGAFTRAVIERLPA
jgi:isocitrate/isopropylmalate dehydrogenase